MPGARRRSQIRIILPRLSLSLLKAEGQTIHYTFASVQKQELSVLRSKKLKRVQNISSGVDDEFKLQEPKARETIYC